MHTEPQGPENRKRISGACLRELFTSFNRTCRKKTFTGFTPGFFTIATVIGWTGR
jgi:hypothetical protein